MTTTAAADSGGITAPAAVTTCPAGGCTATTPPVLFMCTRHRRLVPPEVLRAVTRAWRADGLVSPEFLAARTQAIEAVAAAESRPSHPDGAESSPTGTDPAADSGGIAVVLPLAGLAAHPDNPRAELGDLEELAASIREHGILQPLVAVGVAAWEAGEAGRDRNRLDTPGASHVLVAGHRRAAAARLAGLDAAPVVVRDDLAAGGADIAVMVVENVQRADLSPLEEARGYARLAAAGRSQREIARVVGRGQAHVSKRLSLLRLPEEARQALAAGGLTVAEALELTRLLGGDPARIQAVLRARGAWPGESVAHLVERELRRVAAAEKAEAARAQLAEEGVRVVDPVAEFGAGRWRHLLCDADDVEAARAAGTLAAGVDTTGGITYYTTAPPPEPEDAAGDDGQAAERRECERAMRGRGEAAGRLARTGPPTLPGGEAGTFADTLARAVLGTASGQAVRLAWAWLHETTSGDGAAARAWRDRLAADTDDSAQARRERAAAAHAVTLALDEIAARWAYSPWTPPTAAYLARLEAAGYQPTDWERRRLDAVAGG